jgi:precorrin-3B synthase
VGKTWGTVVALDRAAHILVDLAQTFSVRRGTGQTAAWHVDEVPEPMVVPERADPRVPAPTLPLEIGLVPGGRHVPIPEEGLDLAWARVMLPSAPAEVVVTPWRGILVPEERAS